LIRLFFLPLRLLQSGSQPKIGNVIDVPGPDQFEPFSAVACPFKTAALGLPWFIWCTQVKRLPYRFLIDHPYSRPIRRTSRTHFTPNGGRQSAWGKCARDRPLHPMFRQSLKHHPLEPPHCHPLIIPPATFDPRIRLRL